MGEYTKLVKCMHCGQYVAEDDACEVGGLTWCEDCAEEYAVACERCGELVDKRHAVDVVNEDGYHVKWCEGCAETYAVECECCGEMAEITGTAEVDGDTWCRECVDERAFFCEHCGSYEPEEVSVKVITGAGRDDYEYWCRDCAERDAMQCVECGTWYAVRSDLIERYNVDGEGVRSICDYCFSESFDCCFSCGVVVRCDDAYWSDSREGYLCSSCHDRTGDYLHGYHHTRAEHFFSDGAASDSPLALGLYLGIELEVEDEREERPEQLAEDVTTGMPDGYIECKEDGSLSSTGVEIVTQPATPRYHLEHFGYAVDICRGRGATSHDNGDCGLHIHISRDYLADGDDPDAAGYVLDRLIQEHPHEWMRFSRRTPGQLSSWAKMDEGHGSYDDCKTLTEKLRKMGRHKDYDRYQAVNITRHDTIELRLFRGSLNHETVRATIEAAAALAIVARTLEPVPEVAERMTWDELVSEMRAALELADLPHQELDSYLARRGL